MDINYLDLLMNTKKVKTNNIKTQFEESDERTDDCNSYNKHTNVLFDNEIDKTSTNELEEQNNTENKEIDKEFDEIIQCINKVDNYILDNNYNYKIEKINNYLIDLIYLIKTKKT